MIALESHCCKLAGLSLLVGAAISLATSQTARADARQTDPVPDTQPSPAPLPATQAGEGWVSQKPEFLDMARRIHASRDGLFGTAQLEELRKALQDPAGDAAARVRLHAQLCMELLRLGDNEEAMREAATAVQMVEADPRLQQQCSFAYFVQGVANLRQAELVNCIRRHAPACCVVPFAGAGIHQTRQPAESARASLRRYVQLAPGDLQAWWLINLLTWSLGDDPATIEQSFRIPLEVFDSDYDIGHFEDIAPGLGVNTFNLAGGTIADDFDNDGFLDIVTSTANPEGPLVYYRNLGDGRFDDASAAARSDDQLGGLNCIGGDYDNDGDVDVLVLRGAWTTRERGLMRISLLRNDSGRLFVDVTRSAGVLEPAGPTQTAAWGDFDNDGDLDLYVGHESGVELPGFEGDYPSSLFRNNGDGTFTNIAEQAGVLNNRYCKGVACGDYDNDGDFDLYVSNIGRNRLYRNNGDGTFTETTDVAGVAEPTGRSFATWFFDYDNDGWLDLFVDAYDALVQDVVVDLMGMPFRASPPRLYRNKGDGTFADVTAQSGLHHAYKPMGANFGDLDNDGFLDIYLGTGDPEYTSLVPNVALRNDQARRFQDVTTSGGFGHLQKGHGVAFADLDNDGDQDIYHQLGGMYRGDAYYNALYQNPGHGNHFITIKLVGVKTNRSAVGARIKLVLDTDGEPREVHRAVGSVSSFGGSPLRQEIGLGQARGISRMEIWWPVSDTRQVFNDVPIDCQIQVVEGAERYERIPLTKVPLQATLHAGGSPSGGTVTSHE